MNQKPTTDPPAEPQGIVLVADDHAPNRRILSDTLRAVGYQVQMAKDGAEALQLCASIHFGAVLLDVMMPHFSGYEVCRQLREHEHTAHIPVLLITALTGRSDRLKGVEAGANDFLVKPVDIQDVVLRVRNAVRMKRLQDEANENLQKLKESDELRAHLWT